MLLIAPPSDLQEYIDFAWYTPAGTERATVQVKLIPDGHHGMIVQHLNGRSAFVDEAGTALPVAFVYGQSSAPFINYMTGQPFTMGICLRSHAVKEIFKVDANELADKLVPLDELAGYRITEALLHMPDAGNISRSLFELIRKKLAQYGKPDQLITHSMQTILSMAGLAHPNHIYKTYHLSERQFQRRFRERAGIPLNTYLRVVKFQSALEWLHRHPNRAISDTAYRYGYADQSHFNREFRYFTGHTPKEVAAGRILFPENAFAGYPLQTRRHIISPLAGELFEQQHPA